MSFTAKNQTNPLIIDATGYTPYIEKRLERAKNQPGGSTSAKRDAAIRDYWVRERAIDDMEDYVHHHGQELFRSQWECRADKKSLYSHIRWEMDKLKSIKEETLLKRKERLKELIEAENKMYDMEERNAKPSYGNKMTSMLDRYTDIMVKKELDRQKVAKSKQERQFKNNCDEIRTAISKRICQLVTAEGKSLMDEKIKQDAENNLEDQMYSEAWLKDAEAKAQKDAEESALRRQRNLEFGEHIKQQMKDHGRKREDFDPMMENQIMEEEKRLADLEKEWERAQKIMKQERQKKDLDRCLKNKLRRRAKEVQEDLMLDLYFLEQMIDEASEKKAAKEKKERLKKDQKEYLDYLADQIKKEAEYEKKLEKIYREASDQMWERKEKEWEAERKMRDELNKKAVRECYEQIKTKMEKSRQVQEMRMQYAKEIKKQAEIDRKQAEEEELMKRKKSIENQQLLLEQIHQKEDDARILKEKKQKEWENFKKAEEEYDQKVKAVLADPHLDNLHPYRTSKFY